MNKSLRVLLSLLLVFSLSTSALFARDNKDSESEDFWYIAEVNTKKKVGKYYKGPFQTKENAIANWYYLEIEPNGKYAITKAKQFVTKDPKNTHKSIYEKIEIDFLESRSLAMNNYSVKPDKKIEKKYTETPANQQADKELAEEKKSKKADKKKRASDVNKEIAPLDETNSSYETEKEPQEAPVPPVEPVETPKEEPVPPVKPVETPKEDPVPPVEPVETPKENPVPPVEPVEASKEDPVPSVEPVETPAEIDLSALNSVIEQSATKQISRYKKEFLQDYMLPEEIPEPEDTYSEMQKIENPNEADSNGQTLLMKAAKAGNEWQINQLLSAGADVNLQDNDGWTALMYAARYQEGLSSVELLIKAGADIKIKNKYDISALIFAACYNNNPDLIKKLLSYYYISDKEVIKSFALLLSTKQSSDYIQLAKINIYLDKSIMLNSFYDGKTPLMYAAQFGNSTKVLKMLIDNGAETSFRSTEGKTAFDYAVNNPNLKHDEIYWSLNRK